MKGEWIANKGAQTVVVFIHGFLSGCENSWRNKNGTYWPSLLMEEPDFCKIGIYVFTYKTDIYSGGYDLSDVVDALKENMRLDGVYESRRMIFVCHSMGGIVVRKYIVEKAVDFVINRIEVGLFLVASPSLGSLYADWFSVLARFFGHKQAKVLRFVKNNYWIENLDKEFKNIKEDGKVRIIGKELIEDKFIILKKILRSKIVDTYSAARYFGEPYKVPNSDHFSIAEPESRNAIQNRLLCKFIRDFQDIPIQANSEIIEGNQYNDQVKNLPRRNPNFTGRDKIIASLRDSLTENCADNSMIQILYGLGGIGKTQIAVEYAYRYSSYYSLLWCIHAEDSSSINKEYALLADELCLLERDEIEESIIIKVVKAWLSKHRDWLLVFDNANDPSIISKYLPDLSNGHIIITSRNYDWKSYGNMRKVDVWDRKESIQYLIKRTCQNDIEFIDLLLNSLGDLPLAVEQAAAYIDTRFKTQKEYYEIFVSKRRELWGIEEPPIDYPYTVATTWNIAYQDICECKYAYDLLVLCSVVLPDNIPKLLLLSAIEILGKQRLESKIINSLDFDKAVNVIASYSLIVPDVETISIHKLVQTVVQDKIGEEDAFLYRSIVIKTLDGFIEYEIPDVQMSWKRYSRYLSHAEYIIKSETVNDVWLQLSSLFSKVGLYHTGRGMYKEAEKYLYNSLLILKKNGASDDIEYAKVMHYIAENHLYQCEYDKAKEYYNNAIFIMENKYAYMHKELSQILNDYASFMLDQERYSEAEHYYRRALQIRENYLGKYHPDVAYVLNGLAVLMYRNEQMNESKKMYYKALFIYKNQLGASHPMVGLIYNNLAELYRKKKNYITAEKISRKALKIRQEAFGAEHPSTATTLNNLALSLADQGKYSDSEIYFRRALKIREKHFGPNHIYCAQSMINLAQLLTTICEYEEAKIMYKKALKIKEIFYGSEHKYTVHIEECLRELNKKKK